VPFTLDPDAMPTAEALIKRSRFIARVRHVGSEDEAHDLIALAHQEDRGAGHHCFAYVIGDDEESRIERHSDDGEPGGTAGAPILAALKGHDLVNVAAVVSRHYGGVKLGTGGLARAYGGTVSTALASASLRPRSRWQVYRLAVDHADAGRLEAELRGRGFDVAEVAYDARATLTVVCADADRLSSAVGDLTAGQGELIHAGHLWR
jgi:uncharacterized YigZ family protein